MNKNTTEKPYILHMITPQKNVSPFDANMAADAGYEAIIPYTNVEVSEVKGLVQDAIFSRGPRNVWKTGIFIGGREVVTAQKMLKEAKKSMFNPFEVSVFADPSGAFTTCTASIILLETGLKDHFKGTLENKNVVVFGTGPVGLSSAVMCSRLGAKVTMVGYKNAEEAENAKNDAKSSFGQDIEIALADSDEKRKVLVKDAHVILACSAAGARVATVEVLNSAPNLMIAIDINAVPPSGIENVNVSDNGAVIQGLNLTTPVYGYGALAVGALKYKIQNFLLTQMMTSDFIVAYDLIASYDAARKEFLK